MVDRVAVALQLLGQDVLRWQTLVQARRRPVESEGEIVRIDHSTLYN
jgi:hypothetical protein